MLDSVGLYAAAQVLAVQREVIPTSNGDDRRPVKNHNAARVLATMTMLAIFLCQNNPLGR